MYEFEVEEQRGPKFSKVFAKHSLGNLFLEKKYLLYLEFFFNSHFIIMTRSTQKFYWAACTFGKETFYQAVTLPMILDILIRYQDYNGVRELTMILYISLIHESKEGPKGVRIDRTLADFQINCWIVVNVVYTHFFFNGKATLK